MAHFREFTAQGYKVLKHFTDYSQTYTIIQRKGDYLVAWLYDENDGTWAQGHYGFKTEEEAQNWILNESNIARNAIEIDILKF